VAQSALHPPPPDHDVLVIGAGISGLRAALLLRRTGRRVAVIEASDRVGGRLLSAPLGSTMVDVGGQWIGPAQHRAVALAAELGIPLFPTPIGGASLLTMRGVTRRYTGTIPRLSPLTLLELQRTIWRIERSAGRLDPSAPWDSPDAGALDGQTLASWSQSHVRSSDARSLLAASCRVIFGADPDEIGLLHMLAYVRTAGGLMPLIEVDGGAQQDRLVGGAGGLCERLGEQLVAEGGELVLGQPVRSVRWSPEGVAVRSEECSWTARRLVLALPPALCGRIQFDPLLPNSRERLQQRTPMAATVKLLFAYDRPFWRDQGLSGEAVCTDPKGPITVTFDNTTPADAGGQAGLVAFVVGRPAAEWDALPPPARQAAARDQLAGWFGPAARAPTAMIEKDWGTEPWVRGCPIGLPSPGTLVRHGPALRAPIGPMHFAGTESATEWTGFMEGALQAAERVASEVVATLESHR
jgi:monoamine oxidase